MPPWTDAGWRRDVWPGIHWIQECGAHRAGIARAVQESGADWYTPGRELHVPQNAYLLTGERTLLWDTLSPASGHILLPALEQLLGDRLAILMYHTANAAHADPP